MSQSPTSVGEKVAERVVVRLTRYWEMEVVKEELAVAVRLGVTKVVKGKGTMERGRVEAMETLVEMEVKVIGSSMGMEVPLMKLEGGVPWRVKSDL